MAMEPMAMTGLRLQKYLASCGVSSRRQAEHLIQAGKVQVNGKPITELGTRVDPEQDQVRVEGKLVCPATNKIYLLYHKPRGVVSTCHDSEGRKTVLDSLPSSMAAQGIHPVGRLDQYSSGALLLTNDGDFTLRLTHPRYGCSKTYHVWVQGKPTESDLCLWRQGILLGKTPTLAAQINILQQDEGNTLIEAILQEGRNRQIRRICEQLGYPVCSLMRVAIGTISLGDLLPGNYRNLSSKEVAALLPKAYC
jgi:23S rRNA pseudouridine2605 synthase